MKTLLKLEEMGMLFLGIYLMTRLEYQWWWFALLLAPDISILAYLANAKTGAWTYNLFHHKGIAIAFYLAGLLMGNVILIVTGLILFTHASLDRVFGFGLKYSDSFKNTHLGDLRTKG